MKNLWLLLCCFLLAAGTTYAQKGGGSNYRALTTDCSANGGPNLEICVSDNSFILLGEPATGNVANPPNYQWTLPPGFQFAAGSSSGDLQPTIEPSGTQFPTGDNTFTLCVDCQNGTSCNDINVYVGTQPVDPTGISVNYNACNQATVTVLPAIAPGSGDAGQWTWTPFDNDLTLISGGTSNTAVFQQALNTCGPYTVSYTIVNGGCESNTITTTVDIDNIRPVSAFGDRTICSTTPVTIGRCGSFPGCNGATVSWTQISGPSSPPSSPNTQCSNFTLTPSSTPGASVSYTYQYTVTPVPGSPCTGGSDQVTFTIVNATGFELGNYEYLYFCGDFPATYLACANAGGPQYDWTVISGGATLTAVPGQPECNTVNLPQGSGAPNQVIVQVQNPGVNGQCGDIKRFIFRRLDDVNVSADTVGIGCAPPGPVEVDLRDYLTGYVFTNSASITINSVPANSGIPAPSNTGWIVNLDVEGCYNFTIIVSNVDDLTGQTCSDTVEMEICRYEDIEQPNAGESQSVCADNTILNGSTPTQAGTMVSWTQLSTNPPGAVITSPNQTDPVISGLDISTNGVIYGFVYTFSLESPAGTCEATDTVFITIDCPTNPCDTLQLDAAFSTSIPATGNTVTFQDQSTIAAGFSIDYLTWFFYDDQGNLLNAPGTLDLPGNSISYTFPGPGMYVTCLQASAYLPNDPYNLCCHDMVCDTFIIEDPDTCALHHADFTYSISGNTVTFTDASTFGDVTKWDFNGDGTYDAITNGVGSTTTHTYPGPGTYEVCMISIWNYTDSTCCHDTICERITIRGCGVPTRPRCRIDKYGVPTYYWDAVSGATGYEVIVTVNDGNCCERPLGQTVSLLPIYVSGTSWTPNVSYVCASWQVRAICREGASGLTASQCMNCRLLPSEPQEPEATLGAGRTGAGSDFSFRTYPSPASTFLNVESDQLAAESQIRLVDVSGRLILQKTVDTPGKERLNVQEIPNGIYFLKVVSSDKKVFTQKIIIQH